LHREKGVAAKVDSVTRSQSCHRHPSTRHIDTETCLHCFVLEDTVRHVVLYRRPPSAAKQFESSEAIAWLNVRSYHDLFSFDSICQVFERICNAASRTELYGCNFLFEFSISLGDLTIWKAVTFVGAVATMAFLAVLISFLKKGDT